MKSLSVPAFLLAVTLGAISAAVTMALIVRPEEPHRPEARRSDEHPVMRVDTETLALLDELRLENQDLRERLATLELRPAPAAREPVGEFVTMQAFAALELKMQAWMLERNRGNPIELLEAPELQDEVAAALKTIRKDEAVAGAKKKNEWEAGRLDERVREVSEWLSLDDYQAGEMRTILSAKDAQDRELIRRWEEGVDDETLGETKSANAHALHDEFERVLSAEQLETLRGKFPRPQRRDARK